MSVIKRLFSLYTLRSIEKKKTRKISPGEHRVASKAINGSVHLTSAVGVGFYCYGRFNEPSLCGRPYLARKTVGRLRIL